LRNSTFIGRRPRETCRHATSAAFRAAHVGPSRPEARPPGGSGVDRGSRKDYRRAETVVTAGLAEPAIVGADGPLEAMTTSSQQAGADATQHPLSITRYPHVRTQQLVQGSRWDQHTCS